MIQDHNRVYHLVVDHNHKWPLVVNDSQVPILDVPDILWCDFCHSENRCHKKLRPVDLVELMIPVELILVLHNPSFGFYRIEWNHW